MRPRISKKEIALPRPPTESYALKPLGRIHHRQKSQTTPLLLLPHGVQYSQAPGLPAVPGQAGFLTERQSSGASGSGKALHPVSGRVGLPMERRSSRNSAGAYEGAVDQPPPDDGPAVGGGDDNVFGSDEPPELEGGQSRNQVKRTQQWATWQNIVIPRLVAPYLSLLQCSKSLSDVEVSTPPPCTCEKPPKSRRVSIVNFYSVLYFRVIHRNEN